MTKKKCIECSDEDPCVTLYHGTTLKKIEGIKQEGMINPFVTTSPYSAHHFGLYHVRGPEDRTAIIKIKTPISKVHWSDTIGNTGKQASMDDISHEHEHSEGEEPDDHLDYLLIKDKVKPCQIEPLSQSETIRKVEREKMSWGTLDENLSQVANMNLADARYILKKKGIQW
jgi:hypothetical protein